MAHRDWAHCDLEKPRRALEQCPEKYRDEEWRAGPPLPAVAGL